MHDHPRRGYRRVTTPTFANKITALLMVGAAIFYLLGADSETGPTTRPFCLAGSLCLVAGLVSSVLNLRRSDKEKQ